LNYLDQSLKSGGELECPFNEYDLFQVPRIHKHLVVSFKPKNRWHLLVALLALEEYLGRFPKSKHQLYVVSFELPRGEVGDVIKLDLHLVDFGLIFTNDGLLVAELYEY
jgi:hypothetical protein